MREVSTTDFIAEFGRYREIAQHEPIAVTSQGRASGYFVSAVEFEEVQRLKAFVRRSRAVAEMTAEEIGQLAASRMAPEHGHLDALLDEG